MEQNKASLRSYYAAAREEKMSRPTTDEMWELDVLFASSHTCICQDDGKKTRAPVRHDDTPFISHNPYRWLSLESHPCAHLQMISYF